MLNKLQDTGIFYTFLFSHHIIGTLQLFLLNVVTCEKETYIHKCSKMEIVISC